MAEATAGTDRYDWLKARLDDARAEGSERRGDPAEASRSLGDAAARLGWITPEQLDQALAEQGSSGASLPEPLERILLRHRWLTGDQLGYLLALSRDPLGGPGGLKQLGRYEIRGPLGRGGMSRVFRAYDPVLKREVALKVPEVTALDRWSREAEALARLKHPGIVGVYDVGTDAGYAYLAMELIEGKTLDAAWAPWSLPERVRALEEAAEALEFAHRSGVLHRDLKPGNIMVEGGGAVKVMDFGLARVEGAATLTQTGTRMGTPAYMAPEQVRGDVDVGPAVDLYALGAILYEAMTGSVPFDGPEPQAVYARILNEDPVPPIARNPKAPPELQAICLKAMEKDPRARYASAEAMADDLRRWRSGEPVLARPPSWVGRVRRRVRRNPWAWGATAAAVVLLVVAAAVALALWRTSKDVSGLRLSKQAQEAISEAQLALLEWRLARYTLAHDVTPARRRLQAAVGRLEEAVRLQSEGHQAWAMLGWVRGELGRSTSAREALERAVATAPEEGAYRWWLARVYLGIEEEEMTGALQIPEDGARQQAKEEARRWEARARQELAAALSAPTWGGEPWEKTVAEALLRALEGEPARVREVCEDLSASQPRGSEEAWFLLGNLAEETSARWEAYERAATLAPSWAAALAAAGRVGANRVDELWGGGSDRSAVNDALRQARDRAEAATRTDPELSQAWLSLAVVEQTQGTLRTRAGEDPSEFFRLSIEAYGRALALDPTRVLAWTGRGQVRLNWGTYLKGHGADPVELFREAIEVDYERALGLNPERAATWAIRAGARVNLGTFLRDRGEDPTPYYAGALEDVDRAIQQAPSWALPRARRGVAFIHWGVYEKRQGRNPDRFYEEAVTAFDQAIALDARSWEAWDFRGSARMNLGNSAMARGEDPSEDYRLAVEDLSHAIELNPNDGGSWSDRGLARMNWGEYVASQGGDAREFFRLSVEEDLRRATEINPGSAETWKRLGMSAARWAEAREAAGGAGAAVEAGARAEDAFSRAIALRADDPSPWWRRGVVRLRLGRPEEALADLRRALELDPGLEGRLRPYLDEAAPRPED